MKDEMGRVHPMLSEWMWGTNHHTPVLLDKNKIMSVSQVSPQLHKLFVQFNANIFLRTLGITVTNQPTEEQQQESPTFEGDVGLTEEEQAMRALKFLEFAKPTIH